MHTAAAAAKYRWKHTVKLMHSYLRNVWNNKRIVLNSCTAATQGFNILLEGISEAFPKKQTQHINSSFMLYHRKKRNSNPHKASKISMDYECDFTLWEQTRCLPLCRICQSNYLTQQLHNYGKTNKALRGIAHSHRQ